MSISDSIAAKTDYLHVTVPYDQSGGLREAVLGACGHGDADERKGRPGLYDMYRTAGTMMIFRRGQVIVVGISGGAIHAMRGLRVYKDVLLALADYPHRVTLIDAAYDLEMDAPPILEGLFDRFKDVGVYLGQRPAPVSKTGWKVGATGLETGTIYAGSRKAELRAKVYDKRQEQRDKGIADPGPWIRYEMTITNKAAEISLKDAWDPTALFWRYAGGRLLALPAGVPEWVPGGVGFDLPPRNVLTASERLERFVQDNATLRRGLSLADACGEYGRSYMWSLIQKLGSGSPEDDQQQ